MEYDIKHTEAYKNLVNLQSDNTIDSEVFTKFAQKLVKVHQFLMKNMKLEQVLTDKLTKLKEENTKTLNDYAVLQKQQSDLNDLINRTSEESRKAKVELNEYENTRIANKLYEIEQKKDNIEELKKKIHNSEQEQIEALNKQIDLIKSLIKERNETMEKVEKTIKDTAVKYKDMQILKEKIDFENEKKKKSNIEASDSIMRIQNEIQNEKKSFDQNSLAEQKLKQEIESQLEQMKNKQSMLTRVRTKINDLNDNLEMLKRDIEDRNKEMRSLKIEESELDKKEKITSKNLRAKSKEKETEEKNYKNLTRQYHTSKDMLNKIKLQYDESVKNLKDCENNLGKNKILCEEELNGLSRVKTTRQNLLNEIDRITKAIKKHQKDIQTKSNLEKDKKDLKEEENSVMKSLKEESNNLDNIKQNLIDKVDQLKENIEDMKNLRETISRTVQRLEDSTRQINEEIQIKELIYLDMTKKNDELRHMYQKYHILYETVLAERNKNVVKIQNANQRRAELKEKMKIVVTEMDILNSELTEINNKLAEKDKDLNKINAKQNALKQEINQFKFQKLNYKEEITKLTNENEKLHSILNSIESDMVTIRIDYELACESRNYTGIQLIDRNDELCIFYEKIQHLESEINQLYKNILEKESKIQKLAVDNSEVERFIEVNRGKIPQIPLLSNKIKELDNELKILNKTLEELIKYIESPDNNLKNELPGEDPDIDYLKMKYDQLADMLNEKKELLLEKELINEEINEIAEKLRKKALDDREKNLEISEKMNEYEMKLNDITRKNIASTSELSMFKAILFKLEKTKEEKVILILLYFK
jgi:chromosome segregation ATPase